MGADEEGTHTRFRALHADHIVPVIAQHGGRVFKTTGDGLLAEFPSAVAAVRSAVDLITRSPSSTPKPLRTAGSRFASASISAT